MPASTIHRNPAQVRAAHALVDASQLRAQKTEDEPEVVARMASLVITSGLLPTLAFALETKEDGSPKRPVHARVADAIARHLSASPLHGNLLAPGQALTAISLFKTLADRDAGHLRTCQTEAIAYLGYLKRFSR